MAPASYEEIDAGEDEPVRCLENGLWLLERDGIKLAGHLTSRQEYARKIGMQLEIAIPSGEQGERITRDMLQRIDAALQEARSYRGKVLSLESDSRSGQVLGVTVHRLEPVVRQDIVLRNSSGTLISSMLRRSMYPESLRAPTAPTTVGLISPRAIA